MEKIIYFPPNIIPDTCFTDKGLCGLCSIVYTQQAGGQYDWAQHLSPRGKELGALHAVGGIQAEEIL